MNSNRNPSEKANIGCKDTPTQSFSISISISHNLYRVPFIDSLFGL